MESWKTYSKKLILDMGKWLTVENHTVELPDGRRFEDWTWIHTPEYVNVLAITEDDQALIFRQVKYAVEGETLAPVGGYLEPGEEPLAAAKRELLEETGYAAEEWIDLGNFVVDPNHYVTNGTLFLARRAHYVTPRNADDLEEQHLILMSLPDLETALMDGQIKTQAWVTVIALALLYLKRQG
jgi:ADP-ribose pyrophosphatase